MTPGPDYCDDWECPSKWSCARAWCRSYAYWRFDLDADEAEGIGWRKGPRNPRRAACEEYERDVPRAWLRDVFRQRSPMAKPEIPAGFRLHAVGGGRS